jgi:xanthine dehydrogenase YagS FAD-binding subunit
MKEEIISVQELVDINGWEAARRTEKREDGLHIGALVRLCEIAASEIVRREYTALYEACGLAASPQLRNMGTIAGNFLQDTRCWYYRGPFDCWLKGGRVCFAREGENELHALYGTGPGESKCVSAHPSDPAAALLALGARVRFRTRDGEHEVPVEELYALPEESRRAFVTLPGDGVITDVVLPAPTGGRSAYAKGMARGSWAFPLAGVALYTEIEGSRIREARVGLSGVAPVPWRASGIEAGLSGAKVDEIDISLVAEAFVEGARPLAKNSYKLELLKGLLQEVWERLLHR